MNTQTELNTQEGNKLIAKFMGWHKVTSYNGEVWDMANIDKNQKSLFGDLVDKNTAKYHNSWDWLMPVLKVINGTIYSEYASSVYDNWEMIISPTRYPIENVYNQAVEFIQWHNENKEQ
jgi:hypothetical protein